MKFNLQKCLDQEKRLSLLSCPELGGKFGELVGGVELSLLVFAGFFRIQRVHHGFDEQSILQRV